MGNKSSIRKLELTPAEKLLIIRRRHGFTQIGAARSHGVSLSKYKRWESGMQDDIPQTKKPPQLDEHEWAFIMRRRAGVTQQELADTLGVCRWWVVQMENGTQDPAPLANYWSQK